MKTLESNEKTKIDFDDDDDELEEDTQKDKYLIFRLGNEDYGIEVRYIIEIIGIQKITEVPDTPDFLMGVINLRGRIIPIIDVRTRFNLKFREYSERTCIVIVNFNETHIGLVVDGVSEVQSISESNVEPPPKTNKGSRSRFVQGMGKVGKQVKIILNLERFLNDEELEQIQDIQDKKHEHIEDIKQELEEDKKEIEGNNENPSNEKDNEDIKIDL